MTAIAGTRRTMKELVDGTIRVQIDIDPPYRDQFLQMFGKIDMPVALAPLASDFERRPQEREQVPEKGGQLCKLAAIWCQDPQFWEWITSAPAWWEVKTEQQAAEFVRATCEVESRSELDHNPDAAKLFHEQIRIPYSKWLNDQ